MYLCTHGRRPSKELEHGFDVAWAYKREEKMANNKVFLEEAHGNELEREKR
jgi:hypothetical protein